MSLEGIKELRQRMMLLERAHSAAGMGHFILDARTETIEFSDWVRANLGLNNIPIPLARLPEIFAATDREMVVGQVEKAIKARSEFKFEAKVVASSGKLYTQNISGIAAFEELDGCQEFIGFFGIVRDVTQERIAGAELRRMRDAARDQLEERNNLLAVVSHEIRTPLGGILGVIDQLKRDKPAIERESALRLIEDSCEALLGTLDGVLQKTRLDMQPGQLAQENFSPHAVAKRVTELFRPLARRKGLGISIVGASGAKVSGDAARLQQVMANLVSNAVKFTQSGEIVISVCEPDGSGDWRFKVTDTGAGMDEKRAGGIFEVFSGTQADTLGKNTGSGLGLSITRDLVEAMGGKIEVSSKLGRGSTFEFSIPFSRPVEANVKSKPSTLALVAILVERASVRIQVEAALDGAVAKIVDANTLDPDAWKAMPSPVLVVDSVLMHEIPQAVFEGKHQEIIMVETAGNVELLSRLEERTVRVALSDLSRKLPAIIEDIQNAIA